MSESQLTVRSIVQAPAYQARFAEVLKDRAPQFIASVTSQCAAGPLSTVNPQSVIAAAFIAATLDLPVDRNLGFSWIVPYKGQAQFQMGYRGYVQLALRSQQYERMNAFSVNEEALGTIDDFGEQTIDFTKLDEGLPPVGYAFAFKLISGFRRTLYWSKRRVDMHGKRYSQSYGRSSSPWQSNFDEMALKTVVANALKKWGVLSITMQTALRHDQGAQRDIDAQIAYVDGKGILHDASDAPPIGLGAPDRDEPKAIEGRAIEPSDNDGLAAEDIEWDKPKA